jgi:4-hydroxybenzoate polyprenyltransferase
VKLLQLAGRMLRYRVALMLGLFFALGLAWHSGTAQPRWAYVLGLAALAASYICATCLNDVADREIDAVNHAGHRGRPLVTGEASPRQLRLLAVGAGAVALGLAAPLGPAALLLVVASLAINVAYSMPPLQLSHRSAFAPVVLALAYVMLPFQLGAIAAAGPARTGELVFVAGLLLLFLARIVLKDFRDRAGDARYGKPTLLLCHGKSATCAVSAFALVAGDIALCLGLGLRLPAVVVLQAFVAGIFLLGVMLWRAGETESEQAAIGLGARLGNGLLLMVLAWLVMDTAGAPPLAEIAFGLFLLAAYGGSVLALAMNPSRVQIGYRG